MLGILQYNAGNQTSVLRALASCGIDAVISDERETLLSTQGLIFPGVGAAGSAIAELQARGLDAVLREAVVRHIPVLGICLGCQILLEYSEENDTQLLGLLEGRCRRFPHGGRQEDGSPAPVPHMGWNTLKCLAKSPLLADIPESSFFYFVHSYYVEPDPPLRIATTTYTHEFCSVYGRDGLWGVQFHPEKSGRPGLTLLRNFFHFCERNRDAQ